jgi:hypothetical protein
MSGRAIQRPYDALPSNFSEEARFVQPPEHLPENLQRLLESTIAQADAHPIEYYEALLYDITCLFSIHLGGALPKMESIEMFHPLRKLQESQEDMTDEERVAMEAAIERLLEHNAFAQLDYRLLSMMTELVSGILVKWRLVRQYEYAYRFREAVFCSKLLDIKAVSKNIISMEVLYFACIVDKPPLNACIHQTVRQYSVMVLDSVLSLLNSLLLLTDADFHKVPSISGYFAAHNANLAEKYGVTPNFSMKAKPEYHALSLRSRCLCISNANEKKNNALKELLTEFEIAYRYFESVLVKDLAHIKAVS